MLDGITFSWCNWPLSICPFWCWFWDLLFLLFQCVPLGSLAGIVWTSVIVWMMPLVITRQDAVHVNRVGKDYAVTKVQVLLSESVFLKVWSLQMLKNIIYIYIFRTFQLIGYVMRCTILHLITVQKCTKSAENFRTSSMNTDSETVVEYRKIHKRTCFNKKEDFCQLLVRQ